MFVNVTCCRHNDIYLLTVHFVPRNTWLLPCIDSAVCNYRFYVDAMAANLTDALKAEQEIYDDLGKGQSYSSLFLARNSLTVCHLISRYSPLHV